MLNPAGIIRAKRDGEALDADDIAAFVEAVSEDRVGEAQIGAWLMAVFLRGMTASEQAALTLAMRDSGQVLAFEGLDGPVLDKHSTGGVGDFVSLLLGPLVAACGGYVPMISGRGLGHTGGTLDKLESLPGFRVQWSSRELVDMVRAEGVAIVGQGPDLAPADQRLYAIRDVTATVGCTPLIVSSILSKKLAEGLDALVMDIKCGNGAIMTDPDEARKLGQQLCRVSATAGLTCSALMTDMGQPLAFSAGHSLEVLEAVEFLAGRRQHPRMAEVTLALASELLVSGGLADSRSAARAALERALGSGEAAERFARMVSRQGGPADVMDNPGGQLGTAPVRHTITARENGWIAGLDMQALGQLVGHLGGGRRVPGDTIDHRVGLSELQPVGTEVSAGQPLVTVHAATAADAEQAEAAFRSALRLSHAAPPPSPVVLESLVSEEED